MIKSEIAIRVRYGETDRMGYVYYGNYATYFEVARVELLRTLGVNYRTMEDDGISLPVLEYKIKYIKPAFYDELLDIKIVINELPGVRIKFEYETYNSEKVLLNVAETTLVFVNTKNMKPCQPPDFLLEKMKPFF
ncbi:MAG: acyl-CoA thioesterase [Bacteroidetes bacterium]|nr:acyl-CoA thioesterase [Bacteroidota bacterium]